jgi:hypothetical protein
MSLTGNSPADRERGPSLPIVFSLFLFMAFPMFYFVYKFGDPEPIAHDFFQYYRLYKDWDVNNVIAPLNMRLVGAFFVHLFYKLNFFYDTDTVFDKYEAWGFLKQVYFNSVFFNYLVVAATCTALFRVLQNLVNNVLLSFTGSALFLIGFGTMFYLMMPLTDALSVFLFVIAYSYYLRRNYLVLVLLAVLLFQREYFYIALALLAFIDLVRYRQSYYLYILVACLFFFVTYCVLRQTVFYNSPLAFQMDPGFLLSKLFSAPANMMMYAKQLVLTLNLFFLYVLLVVYKKVRLKAPVDRFSLFKIVLLLVQVHFVSMAGYLGTNAGRYFYLLVPAIIIELVREVKGILPGRPACAE